MSELLCKIESLAIFKGIRETEPLRSFCEFLKIADDVSEARYDVLELYTAFVNELYKVRNDGDLAYAIWYALKNDSNPYLDAHIRSELSRMRTGEGIRISHLLKNCADRELKLIGEIAQTSYADVERLLAYDGYVAQFKTTGIDITERYNNMLAGIRDHGYGMFSDCTAFRFEDHTLRPVIYADPVSMNDLYCYDRQHSLIVNNTRAFAAGSDRALDALLYGDTGTGKSSTVKAAARMFSNNGVRLVELPAENTDQMPELIEMLSGIPMRFIIFIDDISFCPDDERVRRLKSILEGSASGDRRNIIIYATSDHRLMIRRSESDADNGTEQTGLSERFGLRIAFEQPNDREYIEICRRLFEAGGRKIGDEEAFEKACLKFADKTGGRSARTARQFAARYVS